jgi:AcrR family transcriptional regulator
MSPREPLTAEPSDEVDQAPVGPIRLPMAGERRERADAAANRRRILCAAQRLLIEQGADALTMQAVASAAGVGKGTVFHRFGDRDGLTSALINEYMRAFQDLFLHGPPPLGPGAPPQERIEAFFIEFVKRQVDHLELARAAESTLAEELPPVYGTLVLHIATLITEINPGLDAGIVAGYLLSAVAPPVLNRMHSHGGIDVPTLQRSVVQMLRGITSHEPTRPPARSTA